MGSGYSQVKFQAYSMPIKTKQKPEIIKISPAQLDEVSSRVTANHLTENDKKIILSILSTHRWLLHQLQAAKFSMHRLKKMFGFKTEKNTSSKKNNSTEKSNESSNQTSDSTETSIKKQ